MNKEELIQEVAKRTHASQKQVSDVIGCFIDSIEKQVAKGKKSPWWALAPLNPASALPETAATRKRANPLKFRLKPSRPSLPENGLRTLFLRRNRKPGLTLKGGFLWDPPFLAL